MITLNWSSSYKRSFRKAIKKDTGLKDRILTAMKLLEEDPFHPKLKSHKLKGILEDNWACSVDYDLRIIFTFVKNPQLMKQKFCQWILERTKKYIDISVDRF